MFSVSTEKNNFIEDHCKREEISYKSILPAVMQFSRGLEMGEWKYFAMWKGMSVDILLTFGESITCVEGNSEMENVDSYLAALEKWRMGEKHHASYDSFELTLFYFFLVQITILLV